MTTGAARVSDSHCQPSNCNAGIIAIAITGTARTVETIKRCRSARVGSSTATCACAPAGANGWAV
jgi:hypothetical protein